MVTWSGIAYYKGDYKDCGETDGEAFEGLSDLIFSFNRHTLAPINRLGVGRVGETTY